MKKRKYNFLALGDSYTIGESVLQSESFPFQTVQLLRKQGFDFNDPEIIARTGWTTADLSEAIRKAVLHPPFDFVTLLIGVNNEYRGMDLGEYRRQFEQLLKKAIQLADTASSHVIVLSIPDWTITPFADGMSTTQHALSINEYNAANKEISEKSKVCYLDITPGTRNARFDKSLLAKDELHHSGKEYERWATSVSHLISNALKEQS